MNTWICKYLCLLSAILLVACGASKQVNEGAHEGIPEFGGPPSKVVDQERKVLKSQDLQLTALQEQWKLNVFSVEADAAPFRVLEKKFIAPIQFNGWVLLDHIEHTYLRCSGAVSMEPQFILEDDHNGSQVLVPGQKVLVQLEKLYDVRVEFKNDTACDGIDIKFGILYGTKE